MIFVIGISGIMIGVRSGNVKLMEEVFVTIGRGNGKSTMEMEKIIDKINEVGMVNIISKEEIEEVLRRVESYRELRENYKELQKIIKRVENF